MVKLSDVKLIIKWQTDRQIVLIVSGNLAISVCVSTKGIRKNLLLMVSSHPTKARLYLACLSLVFQRYRPSNDTSVLGVVLPT